MRGPGDHVLRELEVSGRVDDDVLALVRIEEDARRVYGNALRLFVLERIEKKGVLERTRGGCTVRPDLLELSFGQRSGVSEQAPDHRALAMIDMAGDDNAHPPFARGDACRINRRCAAVYLVQNSVHVSDDRQQRE